MTHTQVLQLSLIVGAGFFFLGTLFGLLVLAYGRNGLFATRAELDAEVELNVKLLKENDELKSNGTFTVEFLTAGAGNEGAGGKSGHVDTSASSSAEDRA